MHSEEEKKSESTAVHRQELPYLRRLSGSVPRQSFASKQEWGYPGPKALTNKHYFNNSGTQTIFHDSSSKFYPSAQFGIQRYIKAQCHSYNTLSHRVTESCFQMLSVDPFPILGEMSSSPRQPANSDVQAEGIYVGGRTPVLLSTDYVRCPLRTWMPPQDLKSCLGPLEMTKSSYYASFSGLAQQSPKGDHRRHAGTVQEEEGGQTL